MNFGKESQSHLTSGCQQWRLTVIMKLQMAGWCILWAERNAQYDMKQTCLPCGICPKHSCWFNHSVQLRQNMFPYPSQWVYSVSWFVLKTRFIGREARTTGWEKWCCIWLEPVHFHVSPQLLHSDLLSDTLSEVVHIQKLSRYICHFLFQKAIHFCSTVGKHWQKFTVSKGFSFLSARNMLTSNCLFGCVYSSQTK